MFKAYIEYIKDNPEGYWFRRKLFGFGWTPATREGWATLFIFMVFVIGNTYRLRDRLDAGDARSYVWQMILLIVLLICICWRTGEPPKWQWGIPKRDRDK